MTQRHREQPEDKDQRIVQTPYGRGLVVRTRSGAPRPVGGADGDHRRGRGAPIKEVRLLEWENSVKKSSMPPPTGRNRYRSSAQQHPMLYTASELESVPPRVGDDVICQYGRGKLIRIVNVRILPKSMQLKPNPDDADAEEDKKEDDAVALASRQFGSGKDDSSHAGNAGRTVVKYVVTLSSWRLAGGSLVTLYLTTPPLVVRKKTLSEMNACERVEFAQGQKASAAPEFAKKKYQAALNLYAGAVDAVRYVQHDSNSSNELRADLVTVMVTCSNNAATCCAQLGRWLEAKKFAHNALILLDALHGKRGMKVHTILANGGLVDSKLFGEWRVKSFLVMAKSAMEQSDYDEAVDALKKARETIAKYTSAAACRESDDKGPPITTDPVSLKHLATHEKEIKRLHVGCLQKKKAAKKKERQRAQAMFGGGGGLSPSKHSGDSGGGADSPSPVAAGLASKEEKATVAPASMSPGGKALKATEKPTVKPKTAITSRGMLDMRDDEGLEIPTRPQHFGVTAKELKDEDNALVKGWATEDGDVPETQAEDIAASTSEKRVRFAEGVKEGDGSDDEEEEPWYEEHKEALMLLGAAGLAAASVILWRGSRK